MQTKEDYIQHINANEGRLLQNAILKLLQRYSIFANLIQPEKLYSQPLPPEKVLATNFHNNEKYMYQVSKSVNAKFMSILQPVVVANNKKLSKYERTYSKILEDRQTHFAESTKSFVENYYIEIQKQGKDIPYFSDYSKVFDSREDQIFVDTVHFSDKGQDIIAKQLSKQILELEKNE